ncbi:hypothetical protein CROQUDRAFT_722525 [Cronartium quercuum f. sp. fusiforme G11]|uniref:Protein HIR n=1 Tax=Cronartium quercuum f. sp. fusiforme G11 TaxID=708437 RepID=A0A9P6NJF6_9BASI|nr:hypothetical protein CROQUDRAFT_722525 [Cronartium quercuum f. sp. fusiforme G11]
MQIIKPNWVIHEDDKGIPQTIYSLHVHPDGTRLATGSLQNVIKIWATAPILDPALERLGDEAAPRLLCRMEGHDGAVLCVRWAWSGRFLATSSDDAIVMVWFRSTTGNPSKSLGSNTVNIEDWKPWKRLAGHTSDVTGVAWSNDDQYLASVGLDNLVLIWDCHDSAFVLLRRLDLHQGFVKGVVWDPVGQFLATQSDDRTVKIWRTSDWKLEADVKQPFIDCPTSTFFRRLSWSPDGAHIVTPNAMNGPVFVSAVVERDIWSSDISLVGHENVVEVAAYNPRMFLSNSEKPAEGRNICAAFALGARNSISVWLTKSSTPILVLHDVFDRDILDLSWAADGVTLYACSSEGHVAAFVMKEILTIMHLTSPEMRVSYLQRRYPFEKPHRHPQQRLQASQHSRLMSPLPPIEPYRTGSTPQARSFRAPSVNYPAPPVLQTQQMTIMPNGKRRIRPVFLGQNEMYPGYHSSEPPGELTPADPSGSVPHSPGPHRIQNSSLNHVINSLHPQSSNHQRVNQPIVESSRSALARQAVQTSTNGTRQNVWIQTPPIQHCLSAITGQAEPGLKFECLNLGVVSGSKIRLISTCTSNELWSQEVTGRQVVSIALNTVYATIGCDDGTLLVYTLTGRQALPTIALDSVCCVVQLINHFLMSITSNGTIMIWDVQSGKATGPAIRLMDLPISNEAKTSISLTSNGLPIVFVEHGASYTFDRDLMTWIFLKDRSSGRERGKSLLELETRLYSAVVLGQSNELDATLMSHLRYLMATKASSKIEELCSDLWSGRGTLFGEQKNSSTARLNLMREDRIRLLKIVLDCLGQDETFASICDEYRILLRHTL